MGANTAHKAIVTIGEGLAGRNTAPETLSISDGTVVRVSEQYPAQAFLGEAHEETRKLQDQLHQENLALVRERDQLNLLLEVNNVVVSTLDLHELLDAISTCLRGVIHHDYASLA